MHDVPSLLLHWYVQQGMWFISCNSLHFQGTNECRCNTCHPPSPCTEWYEGTDTAMYQHPPPCTDNWAPGVIPPAHCNSVGSLPLHLTVRGGGLYIMIWCTLLSINVTAMKICMICLYSWLVIEVRSWRWGVVDAPIIAKWGGFVLVMECVCAACLFM